MWLIKISVRNFARRRKTKKKTCLLRLNTKKDVFKSSRAPSLRENQYFSAPVSLGTLRCLWGENWINAEEVWILKYSLGEWNGEANLKKNKYETKFSVSRPWEERLSYFWLWAIVGTWPSYNEEKNGKVKVKQNSLPRFSVGAFTQFYIILSY